MGDLIKTPYSEVTSTLELFDRLGVTANDFANLRKASSWQQMTVAALLTGDTYLLELLSLEIPLKQAGFQKQDLRLLAGDADRLRQILQVARGHSEIKTIERVIDCDANPCLPNNYWSVETHQKGGKLKFNPAQVEFYLSDPQKKWKAIEGNELRKELAGKLVLNANILDYLFKNPHIIPEDWKKDSEGRTRYIFFWGTIYRLSDGNLYVRCIYWSGARWICGHHGLDDGWGAYDHAALLAS